MGGLILVQEMYESKFITGRHCCGRPHSSSGDV